MKTQAEIVQNLIDDIIKNIADLAEKINILTQDVESDRHISDIQLAIKKNTIEIYQAQSKALSSILKQRMGEILLIKGIPYTRVDNNIIDGHWDGDSDDVK